MAHEMVDTMTKNGIALSKRFEEVEWAWQVILGRTRAWPFMIAALVLSIAAGILAMKGRGVWAAVLLLTAAAGPGILFPPTLLFSSILILAGILALFVRPPRPKLAPAAVEEIEDVDELVDE
jgi:hypothetical protein